MLNSLLQTQLKLLQKEQNAYKMSRAPKTSPKNISGRSEEEIRQKIIDDVRLKKENFDDLRLKEES